MKKKWRIIIGICAAVAIGLGIFLGLRTSQPKHDVVEALPTTVEVTVGDVVKTVTAPASLVWEKVITLSASSSGLVESVLVRPGMSVNAGDVLVELDNQDELEAVYAAAEFARNEAKDALEELYAEAPLIEARAAQQVAAAEVLVQHAAAALEQMDEKAYAWEVDQARSNVILLEDEMQRAYRRYAPYQHIAIENLTRARLLWDYVSARQAYQAAQTELIALEALGFDGWKLEAESNLARYQAEHEMAKSYQGALQNGVDPDQLVSLTTALEQAEADMVAAEAQLGAYHLKAPADGVVLTVKVIPGIALHQGEAVLELADPGKLSVVAEVIEEDYPLIDVGQRANVYFDALPEIVVSGRVERIVPQRAQGERPYFNFYIALEEVPVGLAAGMTADVLVTVEARTGVLRLPRALPVQKSDGRVVVTVWGNGIQVEREIEIGLRGDVYVEILYGLNVGDQVVGK